MGDAAVFLSAGAILGFTPARGCVGLSGFPMIKTRKSIAKKFKVTGTGKVLRRTAGKRHFLRNKTVKQKRRMSQDRSCSDGVTRFVRIGCPNKF
jgi:large subunit ribosomal protein L35